jgi:uncharacterized protein YegP (UPF0339 family)
MTTKREPRFEVVRTDNGFHARYRARNGRIVWWTENYRRQNKAMHAITLITGGRVQSDMLGSLEVPVHWHVTDFEIVEVRLIDERQAVA